LTYSSQLGLAVLVQGNFTIVASSPHWFHIFLPNLSAELNFYSVNLLDALCWPSLTFVLQVVSVANNPNTYDMVDPTQIGCLEKTGRYLI
jgi:hypothetical protein